MSVHDLLPPNATPLERDLSRAVNFLPRIERAVPTIKLAKRDLVPTSVIPWLVYEYGLGEIIPLLPDQVAAIRQGVPWQRIRGTPAAITTAIGWLGFDAAVDEAEQGSWKWSEYHVGLTAAVDDEATLRLVEYAATISSPARSRCQRIYAVHDWRRFVLDRSLLSDGSILSDHSGTRPFGIDGVQVSFGHHWKVDVDGAATVTVVRSRSVGGEVPWEDRWLLDHSLLDGGADGLTWHLPNDPVGILAAHSPETMIERTGSARTWSNQPWDDEPWGGASPVDGKHTATA